MGGRSGAILVEGALLHAGRELADAREFVASGDLTFS